MTDHIWLLITNLSSLYGYAVRRRILRLNPADPVERPEISTVGTTPARTVEEATALIDGAETIAGVDHTRLTPHVARATAATAATAALDAGVPLSDVQELLGHASPVTTQRYNRGRRKLDSHAAYRTAAILGGGA